MVSHAQAVPSTTFGQPLQRQIKTYVKSILCPPERKTLFRALKLQNTFSSRTESRDSEPVEDLEIGEVVKILGLKSKKCSSIPTHTLRFWEKEFKQLRPKILNGNRRYYDEKNIKLLKKIHYLLKEQGMTINGVKKILNNNKQ